MDHHVVLTSQRVWALSNHLLHLQSNSICNWRRCLVLTFHVNDQTRFYLLLGIL